MWRIEADEIKGEVIRPAPIGTDEHQMLCVVYEDGLGSLIRFSVVTVKDEVLTAKTMGGLKDVVTRAGLVWSENFYMP